MFYFIKSLFVLLLIHCKYLFLSSIYNYKFLFLLGCQLRIYPAGFSSQIKRGRSGLIIFSNRSNIYFSLSQNGRGHWDVFFLVTKVFLNFEQQYFYLILVNSQLKNSTYCPNVSTNNFNLQKGLSCLSSFFDVNQVIVHCLNPQYH